MSRYRFKMACRHWTQIVDEVGASRLRAIGTAPIECEKCYRTTSIVGERQLKDSAKMPRETRKGLETTAKRDARALRGATQESDVASRHWKV